MIALVTYSNKSPDISACGDIGRKKGKITKTTRLFLAAATALCLAALFALPATRAQTSSGGDALLTVRERRTLPVRLMIKIKERPASRSPEYRGTIRVSDKYGETVIRVPGDNKSKMAAQMLLVSDGNALYIDRKANAPAGFSGAFTISGELSNTTRGAKSYPVGAWSVTYTAKDLSRKAGQRLTVPGDKADLIVTVGSR